MRSLSATVEIVTVTVRTASRRDARAIAHVRVETWRAAYRGLIAGAVLEALDAEKEGRRRAERWSEFTADPRSRQLVALDGAGAIVGWAALGRSRDADRRESGELYALYALPTHWSTGIGHALMVAAEDTMRAAGFDEAHLWVLRGNDRAASFYEQHGWREDGSDKVDDALVGQPLHERRRVKVLSP
ncbi:MAG: GNAT family N-acetyltransferase [Actinobacteria bacterium]|nr:GNAT family N-acetyltransferase [Actinomycetota bacterium]